MPELPDVEVFRRYLNRTALHKKITRVDLRQKGMLGAVSATALTRRLKNRKLRSTSRHGKYLLARIDKNYWLILHFGMTGFLRYYKDPDEEPGHVRLRLDLTNGYHLAYDCQRKLGLIDSVKEIDTFIERKQLGPDPMSNGLSFDGLRSLLASRKGSVKSALMNQQLMAGIGNIYSDEILYHAGIHPATKVSRLSEKRLKELYHSMKKVLGKAIEVKADPDKFPRSYLLPVREEGADCPKCGGRIKKATIAGRSSYYCSDHQKKK